MRATLLTLVLSGWAIACTPERVPPPAAQPPPTSATRPAPAEIAAPENNPDDSEYVKRLHAQLQAPGPWTLVPELQRLAERSLDATGYAGALVAIDPEDGKVLALYSVSGDRGDPLLTVHEPASTLRHSKAKPRRPWTAGSWRLRRPPARSYCSRPGWNEFRWGVRA